MKQFRNYKLSELRANQEEMVTFWLISRHMLQEATTSSDIEESEANSPAEVKESEKNHLWIKRTTKRSNMTMKEEKGTMEETPEA